MKHRILLIDDDPEIVNALQTYLDLNGFGVQSCTDPEAGWGLFLKGGFHMVLLDIMMPKLDGVSLLRKIKAARPEVEVVMITACNTLNKAMACWDAGAADYIVKPFTDMDGILRIVQATSERIRRWEFAHTNSAGGEPAKDPFSRN